MSKFSISAPQNESHQQEELQKGSKRRHFRLLYGKSDENGITWVRGRTRRVRDSLGDLTDP